MYKAASTRSDKKQILVRVPLLDLGARFQVQSIDDRTLRRIPPVYRYRELFAQDKELDTRRVIEMHIDELYARTYSQNSIACLKLFWHQFKLQAIRCL